MFCRNIVLNPVRANMVKKNDGRKGGNLKATTYKHPGIGLVNHAQETWAVFDQTEGRFMGNRIGQKTSTWEKLER